MATSLQKRHEEHRSEKLPEIDMSCNLRTLQVPKHKMEPTFLSSYPGSGTKLQWELVEALTGVPTTDDAFSNGHHNVVGIKTHYPCPAGREFPGAETIQRAIIFVRHPMDTIAAYHDIIYASENNLPWDAAPRAPLASWIKWRDAAFARELEIWRKHFTYWIERYTELSRLIVPYEQLVRRKEGPDIVVKMAEFLSRTSGVNVVNPDDIPCVWQTVINSIPRQTSLSPEQEEKDEEESGNDNEGGKGSVEKKNDNDEDEDEDDDPARRHLRKRRRRLLEEQPQTVSTTTTATTPSSASSSSSLSLQQQLALTTSGGGADTMQVPSQSTNGSPNKQQQPLKLEENKNLYGQVPSNVINPTLVQDTEEHDIESRLEEDAVTKKMQELMRTAPPSAKTRKSDPDFRPYTEPQRKEIVVVLAQLLETYRNDKILTPILVGYIDQVEKRYSDYNY